MTDNNAPADAATSRCVLVTGAYGALGSVVSEAFARIGYRVARVNHGTVAASAADATSFGIGNIDLSKPEEALAAVAAAMKQLGRLDAVVNVAGGFAWEKLSGSSAPTWERLYSLNLRTCLNTCVAALPHLPEGGRIINIGAMAAAHAAAGMGAYAAAKSSVHRLTESLAAELLPRRITVNAILPSTMDTPQNRLAMPDSDPTRWTRPEAVAEVILFLASPQSEAVSGALIPVGGIY
jgi:NAD(P)-dependent dehydrogenase (short-subunit alcohol dehydrogenase family)